MPKKSTLQNIIPTTKSFFHLLSQASLPEQYLQLYMVDFQRDVLANPYCLLCLFAHPPPFQFHSSNLQPLTYPTNPFTSLSNPLVNLNKD